MTRRDCKRSWTRQGRKLSRKKLDLRKCVHTEAKRIQRSAINESERRILLQALPGDSSFDVKYLQKKLAELKKEMAELQEAAHQTMMPKERGKPLEEEIKRLEVYYSDHRCLLKVRTNVAQWSQNACHMTLID
eukprot:scpid89929/ scgid2458/ 